MSETVAKKSAWTQLRLGWQAWVELLARKEAATALALVRIGVGAVTLHTMTAIYFMDVMEPLWANKDEGGIVDLANKNWLVEQLGGASLDTSHTLLWTCAAACVLLILGLGSRVAALVALLCEAGDGQCT